MYLSCYVPVMSIPYKNHSVSKQIILSFIKIFLQYAHLMFLLINYFVFPHCKLPGGFSLKISVKKVMFNITQKGLHLVRLQKRHSRGLKMRYTCSLVFFDKICVF